MNSSHKRRRIAELHPSPRDTDVFEARKVNDLRLKSRFESICTRYGRDFDNVGDEIDLRTGRIVIDNGHLEQIAEQYDTTGLWDDFHSDDNPSIDAEIPKPVARNLRSGKVPPIEARQQPEQFDTHLNRKYKPACEPSIRLSETLCHHGGYIDGNVTPHTAKGTPGKCDGCSEKATPLRAPISHGRACADQAQGRHTANRWASRACPDSNDEGHYNYYESTGHRHVRKTQDLISACTKDIGSVVPPRQGQPLSDHAESALTLSRADRPHIARPKNKRGVKGITYLDTTVQNALRADSDSDDPLQQNCSPSQSPFIAKFPDAKVTKRTKNAGGRMSQKAHPESKNNLLSDNHETKTATERVPAEMFANLDVVQVVASNHGFDLNLQTSPQPLFPGGIPETRTSAVLTPDEVKCLVNLRIMEKRPWSKVLTAMPRRNATQLKHWYYKYCVEARKEGQVSIRSWTSEEKRRLRSLQPSYQLSWEAVLSNFPNKTLDELQHGWIQACQDELAGQKIDRLRPFCAHAITRKTKTDDIRLGQGSKVPNSSDLPKQAKGRPISETSMRNAKSESPDPLVCAPGDAWPGISNSR